MKIELLLFATAKDLFGQPTITVELPESATVVELKHALIQRQPDFADLISRCAFSVDQQYASDSTKLQPEQEIAMIPPVSGG